MTRPRAALVASTLLLLGGVLGACGDGGSSRTEDAYQEGAATAPIATGPRATAPEGAVSTIAFERFDGTPASFAEYGGRPLVVNFFANWCAPCVRELPDVEEVHQRLGDQVAFLGISVNERAEEGRELAEATGITFDLGRDPRSQTLEAVGGVAMPTTALVDAAGQVVHVRSLAYDSADELEADIRRELLS